VRQEVKTGSSACACSARLYLNAEFASFAQGLLNGASHAGILSRARDEKKAKALQHLDALLLRSLGGLILEAGGEYKRHGGGMYVD
jgi:hypothetical protein